MEFHQVMKFKIITTKNQEGLQNIINQNKTNLKVFNLKTQTFKIKYLNKMVSIN